MSSTIKQAIQALKSRVADAFAAVEAKGGTLPATQDTANLPAAIASIPAGGDNPWSGHVDEIGLASIGWTNDDIEELKKNIFWGEGDDDIYKVPQELIDLYQQNGGWNDALTNTHAGKWYFLYMPRPASGMCGTTLRYSRIMALPIIRFTANYTFTGCPALLYFKGELMVATPFRQCYSLRYAILGEGEVSTPAWWTQQFADCDNCKYILPIINYGSASGNPLFPQSLSVCYFKNIQRNLTFGSSSLSKESVIYMIQNTSATIVITISSMLYEAYSVDADVLEALASHPNVTLASA